MVNGSVDRDAELIQNGSLLSAGLPAREAARRLGVPRSTFQRWMAQNPPIATADFLKQTGLL
jgi:transposase